MKNALKIAAAPLGVAGVILAVWLGVPHAKADTPAPPTVKVITVNANAEPEATETPTATPQPPAPQPAPAPLTAKRTIRVNPDNPDGDPAKGPSSLPDPGSPGINGGGTIDGGNTPPTP